MFGRKKKESHTETNQNVGTINLGMAGYFGGLYRFQTRKELKFISMMIELNFVS